MDTSTARTDVLKTERDRYVSLAFCWADLLFEIDRQFTIVFAAGATRAFFGKNPETLAGTDFRRIVAPADVPLLGHLLKQISKTGRSHDEVIRIVGPQNSLLWVSLAAYCIEPGAGNLFVGLRRSRPFDPRTGMEAHRDRISGLYDGGSFADIAADRLKKIQSAGENARVTLLSVLTGGAKNRHPGEENCAALSQSIGDFLKANSIGGDSAAKIADGRFSILHSPTTDMAEMTGKIEALIRRTDPTRTDARVESATIVMDAVDLSEEDLAKGLLYTLNRFREDDGMDLKTIAAKMTDLVNEAASAVSSFKTTVDQAKFHVALQPIVGIRSGEIHHYEALCRFDASPAQSPFKTITFAEETGLIHEFDLAMAQKVIDTLAKFPRNNDKYRIAVNVSGFSIGKPAYVSSLTDLLQDTPWTRGKLLFEITESSRMTDLDSANAFIQGLRGRGYPVCLDDFGASAASFQYLSVLDVDVVKIDGSAVKNAQRVAKGRAFLSALTELCRRMGVETIAEMVDAPEALDFCRDCGCTYVQGYLFGKPSSNVRDFSPLPHLSLFK